MNGDLDEIARAELVEREPCPRCGAPPGSVCRTNSGVVAVDYHTGRYSKIPMLKSGPAIRIPAARGPGRAWEPGPEPDLAVGAALARAGDRIGYARVSSKGQDLAGQVRLLKKANCVRIYVEKIGTREKIRPEYNEALADLRPADTLTVTMLDRLGRNMVELITCAQDLAERDHRLEILGGPLAGIYDPQGAGKVVFAVFAAMAEVEREFIHERTLIGLDTAAANGNHGGRPPAVDGDMLAVALRRRDANEPVTSIARRLGVGRSTLYRTLAAYDEAIATGREPDVPVPTP
ncbi:recombinase family protein [Streptomyces sp. SID8111]|uniref:recombinase family protein n=1 Tax=Streptomyces sp. SID8111 TaxID=2706100 RepID=UPI0013C0D897|nr:recombinase family protein [Streptomyces sp. SID8111]NEB59734.1 recombinase family protein [Streptomyces diastaticus]NEC28552.1 recombinase family protein [Streptomyces sp. SID8111]